MATRKPPSSGQGTSRIKPTAIATRPRTQISRASTIDELSEPGSSTTSTPIRPPVSFASPTKIIARNGEKREEMNVQVVVRCRIRSEREIADGSPIIVSTQGARSEEITIETAAATSNMGIYTQAPTKTYPFDRVFGPEADQAMIYNDVVQPILEEVVQGYNCTLFAYGQTGTGKTYTMQGDLTPSVTGGPCADAGMIPRVLSRLYQYLETSVADYSVKLSYVELYNEELRDLLAPEMSAPAGSAQPMGLAGTNAGGGLKIFDEAGTGKRGVLIQGLEDTPVKDFNHAIALLRKGSYRRQIASTKFNDHSSRSHSIFTITVHTKETCSKGDEALRVGKLNLVDLAGSENIGRSGAENKRAREAGMINQSLLTLGRVINALVDQSPHVPYRESKLTRLLQDSLGGRTKTCIIATVSPAKCNMEETLSTLDYALRAKSIRNKPEINQRMTRNGLLKEYVGEIEKLKADLIAAREKNGIWFSKESWEEMSGEHQQLKTLYEENRKQVEIIGSQMRAVREEFEQGMALLMRSEGELKDTKEKLASTEGELRWTESELQGTKTALQEEVVVREAFEETEGRLDGVARSLKTVAKESVKDVGGLFSKLDRKSNVFTSNSGAVAQHSKSIESYSIQLEGRFNTFAKDHEQRTLQLKQKAALLRRTEAEALRKHSESIISQLKRLSEAAETIRAQDASEAQATSEFTATLHSTTDAIIDTFASWEGDLNESCQVLSGQIVAACEAGVETATKAFKSAIATIEDVTKEAQDFVQAERQAMSDIITISEEASAAEISRLRNQNNLLTTLLDSEKVKAEKMRDDLIKQVSSLLCGFTDARDRSMREAIDSVRADIREGQQQMGEVEERARSVGRGAEVRYKQVEGRVVSLSGEGRRVGDGGLKALSTLTTTVQKGLTTMHQGVVDAVNEQRGDLERQTGQLTTTYTAALERLDRSKRARIELTSAVLETDTGARGGFEALERGLSETSERVERGMQSVVDETTNLSVLASDFVTAGSLAVSKIRDTTGKLSVEGTREDVSTGATPRKRTWDVVESWERTKGREEVLREWKARHMKQGRQPVRALATAAPVDSEDQQDMEDVEVEQGLAAEVLSPGPSSATLLPSVVEPREAKEPSPPTEQPPPPPKLTEQPMMFGDLPTGPPPSLKPRSESAAPPPSAKPSQMKKPRSVSGTISGKPPSNGARKAAPLSEKPVNLVGTRGGLRRGVNGAGR
ncbi:kinesin motor protein cin8 [Tulasnella sp. 424]|nr:kinesin motor protein cin8 [Tulasnella sp. 424]KAG8967816.1 kinesin motor protein cin8 [Tulasnella sp. 425]